MNTRHIPALLAVMLVCLAAQADKTALLVIAPKKFDDAELKATRAALEAAGVKATTASTTTRACAGLKGAQVKPEILLNKASAADYDLIVFIGGPGATTLFDNKAALALARGAIKEKKLLGAIGIAPCILANAGALKDKNATVQANKKHVIRLRRNGAHYRKTAVTRDNDIITANGPAAAKAFGAALVKALSVAKNKD